MVLLQQRLQPVKVIEKIKTEVLDILSGVSLFSLLPGSVGVNIPKMLELFKFGHDYMVEKDCYIRTQVATVRLKKKTQHVTVVEEELKNMSVESLFKTHFSVRRIFSFSPLLFTARHAQRAHLRQPANYPDWRLLPPASRHGYVDQNQPRVQPLTWKGFKAAPRLSAADGELCLNVVTALQDRYHINDWILLAERQAFRVCQLLCAGWVGFPSPVQFILV